MRESCCQMPSPTAPLSFPYSYPRLPSFLLAILSSFKSFIFILAFLPSLLSSFAYLLLLLSLLPSWFRPCFVPFLCLPFPNSSFRPFLPFDIFYLLKTFPWFLRLFCFLFYLVDKESSSSSLSLIREAIHACWRGVKEGFSRPATSSVFLEAIEKRKKIEKRSYWMFQKVLNV